MTDEERKVFCHDAERQAADLLARGEDLPASLGPLFHAALRRHPDEEDRLLELWDRLVSRSVL